MTNATYAIRRNQNLYRSRAKVQLGPTSVSFVMVAAIGILALLYLNQITKTSIYGYKLTELTHQRDAILATKQELEVQAARLQSIQQIQSSPSIAGMVPAAGSSYIH